jgi:hypothetical protein
MIDKTLHRRRKIEKNTKPTKNGEKVIFSGQVISSCSNIGTHCITLSTHPVISHEWGMDGVAMT